MSIYILIAFFYYFIIQIMNMGIHIPDLSKVPACSYTVE